MVREQTCGLCGCICFSVQTRLSPLEEIHKQELASGKKQGEAMVKVGGCRVPRHVSWASGFVQGLKLQWEGGVVEVVLAGWVSMMIS